MSVALSAMDAGQKLFLANAILYTCIQLQPHLDVSFLIMIVVKAIPKSTVK